MRQLASRLINDIGLRRPVFRLREWLISRTDRRTGGGQGAPPTPSSYLRTLVIGTSNLDWFLESGQRDAEEFDSLLRRHGSGLFDRQSVLEWGCGCGRLSRWVAPRIGAFTGVDINPRLIRWCGANLPGRYLLNKITPPLPLGHEGFEVIYGCSVLTHLREASARSWFVELARVLQPGGRALLTFHDPQHPSAAPVRDTLERDGWAVRFDDLEGSNHLAAYATSEHLAVLAAPALTLLDYIPSTASTSAQAVAVFAKT